MPPVTQPPPKHKVLSTEQQESMMERLYGQSVRNRNKRIAEYNAAVDEMVKRKDKKPALGALSEKEEKQVQHLYTQSMERKNITLKKLEDKFVEKPHAAKTLQEEELTTMAERLHSQSKAHREQMLERLETKIYGKKGEGQSKLTKGQMEESVARQFKGAVEKKSENMQKLEDKYLFHPPKKTIDAAELSAMADRLSKKESK